MRTWLTMLTALLAAAALLLAGCAQPGALPDAQPLRGAQTLGLPLAVTSDLPAPRWWQALGDPALDGLVERALADQPSLAQAAARWSRANAGLAGVSAGQGPQAGLAADLTRQRYSEHGLYPPPLAGSTHDLANVQLGGSVELDFFGRHGPALQAALSQQQVAAADLQAARVLLATQVVRGYVALARWSTLRDLAAESLRLRQAQWTLTRQRVQAGLDTQLDLRLAEAARTEAQVQIEAHEAQITLARHQLAALTGQSPQALQSLAPPALAAFRSPALPQRLGADLLGRRADVVAARWRVEAALQDVAAARTQFYPDINLVGTVGLNALGLHHLLDLGSRGLTVGPALRLPLFDGGRLQANLRGRAADADAATAAYNVAVLEAVREVADATAQWQSLARQQQIQAQGLATAEAAQALTQQRHRAGLGTQLVVLSAEVATVAQRANAADLQARLLDTQANLMRALGGGWATDLPGPAAPNPN